MPPSGGGDAGAHRLGQEGQGHQVVSLPLLTPRTFLCAATPFGRAAKRGLRGLGSGRRFAYRTLLCPEFTLRDLPRITVRGQTVQGGRVLLRKAPLPSRMCPWSTRRPCGPLVFSRATAGSRGSRKVKGVSRGDIGNRRCPTSPFAPVGGHRPSAAEGGHSSRPGQGVFRLQRRTAVPAEGIPPADGQKGDGKNSELTLAEKGELFYNKINTWEDFFYD